MSKRYGRNQKRKHREKIAELENWKIGAIANQEIIRYVSEDRRRKLEGIITMVKRITEHSIVNDPVEFHDSNIRTSIKTQFYYPLRPQISDAPYDVAKIQVETINLNLLAVLIEENYENFAKTIYLKYYGPDGKHVGYMVTKQAIACMPEQIIMDMAVKISKELLWKAGHA